MGDLKVFQWQLRQSQRDGRSVDELRDGLTALHWAVQEWQEEMALLLLQSGADPNLRYDIQNKEGDCFLWSAIHAACRQGNVPILEAMLERGGDPNLEAYHKLTPLHTATWHGKRDVVDTLIKHGCDVNQLDVFHESALVIPICHGDSDQVEKLLEAGCKLNSRSWGNIRKIRGKNETDFRHTMFGRDGPYTLSPLAIKYAWLHIGRQLLRHGINPNKYEIEIVLQQIKVNVGLVDEDGCRLVDCLVDAGYRFRPRDYVDLQRMLDKAEQQHFRAEFNINLIKKLMNLSHEPLRLQQLCRNQIRGHLRLVHQHRSILKPVRGLPLPGALRDYLSLKEYQETDWRSDGTYPTYDRTAELYLAMPKKPTDNKRKYAYYKLHTLFSRT